MTDEERQYAVRRVVDAVLVDDEDEENDEEITEEELAELAKEIDSDEDPGDPGLVLGEERETEDGHMGVDDENDDGSSGDPVLVIGVETKAEDRQMEGGDKSDNGDSGGPDVKEFPSQPMEDASDTESVHFDALDVEPYDPILEY